MKRKAVVGTAFVLCATLLCALLSGCATYRLGSMLPPGVRTVYVPTFVNETAEPFIEVDATRATLQAIQMDGSLRLAGSPETADSILSVTLVRFELEPVAFDAARRAAANEYRLTISARVLLTHAETGEVIAQNPLVQGETTFDVAGDLTTSKTRGLPAAVRDLGRRIVPAIVESW